MEQEFDAGSQNFDAGSQEFDTVPIRTCCVAMYIPFHSRDVVICSELDSYNASVSVAEAIRA